MSVVVLFVLNDLMIQVGLMVGKPRSWINFCKQKTLAIQGFFVFSY